MTQRSGQCLCGKVKIAATLPSLEFQACHCVQCQRWTGGGPHYAIRVSDLEIEGRDEISSYFASEWGERANCKTCGSVLFWKMRGKDPAYVAVGLLDDQTGLSLSEEIFVDRRADWMHALPDATQSTEAEQQAALQKYLEGQS